MTLPPQPVERDGMLTHELGIWIRHSEGNQYQTHPGMDRQGCGNRNGVRSDQARQKHHGDMARDIGQVRAMSFSWKQLSLSAGWPSLRALTFFIRAFFKVSGHVCSFSVDWVPC